MVQDTLKCRIHFWSALPHKYSTPYTVFMMEYFTGLNCRRSCLDIPLSSATQRSHDHHEIGTRKLWPNCGRHTGNRHTRFPLNRWSKATKSSWLIEVILGFNLLDDVKQWICYMIILPTVSNGVEVVSYQIHFFRYSIKTKDYNLILLG